MKKQLINEDGFYAGSELMWSLEDVLRVLNEMNMTASKKDLGRVLIASFQDNDMLMQYINDAIGETIAYMIEEGQLKTEEL
jgi:hypothetical protein|tara:strand:+ start:398 stop:640 length:243 start_codon:yes stop_codon:yes gene_type:complete